MKLQLLAGLKAISYYQPEELTKLISDENTTLPRDLKNYISLLANRYPEIAIAETSNYKFLKHYFDYLRIYNKGTCFHKRTTQGSVIVFDKFGRYVPFNASGELVKFLESIPENLREIYVQIKNNYGVRILDMSEKKSGNILQEEFASIYEKIAQLIPNLENK